MGEYDQFVQECPNSPLMMKQTSEQTSMQMLTCKNSLLSFSDDIEHLNL